MSRLLLIKALCLGAVLSVALPVHALKFISDENSPFAYTDPASKKITGVTTDMVEEAARRAKVPYTLELVPWARAYSVAKNVADTCVFPLARLPERDPVFQWIGPLSTNKWVLFAKNDFKDTINSLEDAKKYNIGGLLKDGPAVLLESEGVNVEVVGDNLLNIRKLTAGRIDLWATGLYRGKILAAEAGGLDIKPVLVIKEVDHYLACNLAVPENTIKALNKAVQTMHKDGWIKKINNQYQNLFLK